MCQADIRAGALFAATVLAISSAPARAADEEASNRRLSELTLEELMNEPVTSVSKKTTRFGDSPAAISVITQDDIRRLGITSFAEAFRLVPGMDVARIDSHNWAISARGAMGQFANKLLALIDGRSIYEPSIAGVYWANEDTVLEDLDRIEVIRGPGAALWGANAMNGVVNIITKPAQQTQGLLLSSSAGTADQPSVSARYGGRIGDASYRIYAKYFNRDGLVTGSGADAPDDWHGTRAGFRSDWERSAADLVTLQADYFENSAGKNVALYSLTPPYLNNYDATLQDKEGFVLGRWTHKFSAQSEVSIQGYYTHSVVAPAASQTRADVADVQVQGRTLLAPRHDVVWGVSYRHMEDETPVGQLTLLPERRTVELSTAFVQDDIELAPDLLQLSIGSKFEHDTLTGFQVEPGMRLLWSIPGRGKAWAAVSRAVRTPDRFESDGNPDGFVTAAVFPTGPGTPPAAVVIYGHPDVEPETLLAYEIGYRVQPSTQLSLDTNVFFHDYGRLIDYAPGAPFFDPSPVPHVVLPQYTRNAGSGQSYGAEATVQWSVTDRWRLAANYSWLHQNFRIKVEQVDAPSQQASLRSYFNLRRDWEINGVLFYTDRLSVLRIPSYLRLDLGMVWHVSPQLEAGIWGENLLDARHPELLDNATPLRTEVPRSALARLVWRY